MKAFLWMLSFAVIPAMFSKAQTSMPEQYLAVYGGVALISGGTINGTVDETAFLGPNPPPYDFSTPYDQSTSGTAGLRYGCWSPYENEAWEWGFAADVSFFREKSDTPGSDIKVFPMSLLAFLRYPMLVSENHPQGRTYPYFGIGPSLVLANVTTEAINVDESRNVSVLTKGIGFDFRTGWAWRLSDQVDWFIEYRFLAAHVSGSNENGMNFVPEDNIDVSTSFTSHHLLSGFSFGF